MIAFDKIMNLIKLVLDIQEEIFFLPLTERGRDAVTERDLRLIVVLADWNRQQCMSRIRQR